MPDFYPLPIRVSATASTRTKGRFALWTRLKIVIAVAAAFTCMPVARAFVAASTTTTLAVTAGGSSTSSVASGTVVTLTATVSAGGSVVPGLVNFCDATATYCLDAHLLGSAQVTSAGTATFRFRPGIGSHSYKAVFVGTKTAATSASSASALAVTGSNSTTTLASSGSAGSYTLTATVTGSGKATIATGNISFIDSTNTNYLLGSATLSGTSTISFSGTVLSSAAPEADMGLASADFNLDGIPDLAISPSSYPTVIYLGVGDGTFTQVTTSPVKNVYVGTSRTADFNEDGIPDLLVMDLGFVNVLLGKGDGTFAAPVKFTTQSGYYGIQVGDFNGDGHADIVVSTAGQSLTLLLGDGTGSFSTSTLTFPTGFSANTVAVADFNNDGNSDIVFSSFNSGGLLLWLSNGDGTFTSSGQLESTGGGGVVTGDFNRDGSIDILSADGTLFLGAGTGSFTMKTGAFAKTGSSVTFATGDFNSDGVTDVASGVQYSNSVSIFPGNGDGTFSAGLTQPVGKNPTSSLISADLNGDGVSDFAVVSLDTATVSAMVTQLTSTATATLSGVSPTGSGTHQVKASFAGDTNYTASASNNVSLTAEPVTTNLVLVTNPTNSANVGQQVLLTAKLSPYTSQGNSTDGETITFLYGTTTTPAGATPIGTGTLSGGVATLNITSLPIGAGRIFASYSGDTNFSSAISYSDIDVNYATKLTLAADVTNSTYHQPVTFTATLSPSSGSGVSTDGQQVVFTAGSVNGVATLSGGVATFVTSSLIIGTPTMQATYSGNMNFTSATSNSVQLTVAKITPTLTWSAPSTGVYTHQTVGTSVLNATSTTLGPITYTATLNGGGPFTISTGSILSAGTYVLTATLTPNDSTYATTSKSVSYVVTPASLLVSPSPISRTYGSANPVLAGSVVGALGGDTFTVSGSTTATTNSAPGQYPITYTVTGANIANYSVTQVSGTLTVTKATPTIMWSTPSPITYGTVLSSTQLNAVASVPGTLAYTPALGIVLSAGNQSLQVTFTPTDVTDYSTQTASVTLAVTKVTPSITWPTPAAITYGTALNSSQLNAMSNVAGTFAYSPSLGSVPSAGSITLTMIFTPTDQSDYSVVTSPSVTLLVNKAPLGLAAASATRLYGAANPVLSGTISGAVNGDSLTESFTTVAAATSGVGTYAIVPSVTGTTLSNYSVSVANGTLTVTPTTLTVVPSNASRAYGLANPIFSASVTGAANGDTFTVTGTTTATANSTVGSYPITYTVIGTNLTDYVITPATGTLSVTPGTPTITWTPAGITYGTALGSSQLNATASTSGSFSYSPAAGVVLSAGTPALSVTFTPTDNSDFSPVTKTVSLAVAQAPLSISAVSAVRVFGAANPAFTGSVTGLVNGDTVSETFSTTATASSIVGSYPIVPSVSGSAVANYNVTATNGALAVSQAGTATTFALSNANTTFTANVSSLTTGSPSGTVSFYIGQNLVGSATVSNGVATYSGVTIPSGNTTLSAQYSGDANFTQSASPAILILAVTPVSQSLTVTRGSSVTDTLVLTTPVGYSGSAQLTCTGLPASSTCSFSPATVSFAGTGAAANVVLTVQTNVATSKMESPAVWKRRGFTEAAALLWMPGLLVAGCWMRKRPSGQVLRGISLMILLFCIASVLGGCASGSGSSTTTTTSTPPTTTTPAGSTTFQVVATASGGATQSTSINLNVQ